MIGWYFSNQPLAHVSGKWQIYAGEKVKFNEGLSITTYAFDALHLDTSCDGSILHRAELEGELVKWGEECLRVFGRRRMILQSFYAEPMLWRFARWCALQVVHMWNPPMIVQSYLKSGHESDRRAANAAAWKMSDEIESEFKTAKDTIAEQGDLSIIRHACGCALMATCADQNGRTAASGAAMFYELAVTFKSWQKAFKDRDTSEMNSVWDTWREFEDLNDPDRLKAVSAYRVKFAEMISHLIPLSPPPAAVVQTEARQS